MTPDEARQEIINMLDGGFVEIPADNFTAGRGGVKVDTVVIHIMDGTSGGTESWFKNPASDVSAHFGISKAGELTQFVSLKDTAWHAGGKTFNNNQRSVGIEHEGRPTDTNLWPIAQLEKSARLTALLLVYYGLTVDAIQPHSYFNPGHRCPGDRFPWDNYRVMVRRYLSDFKDARPPKVQAAPIKAHNGMADEVLILPLYTPGGVRLGSMKLKKTTGKAFISTDLNYKELLAALHDLGYTKFRIDE